MNPTAVEAFAKLLGEMAAEIAADLVEQRLRAAAPPRYATPKENPLGSARAFREAAGAGAFKTFRRGKQTAALWSDVEAWMLTQPPPPPRKPKADGARSLRDELLMAARPPTRKRRTAA